MSEQPRWTAADDAERELLRAGLTLLRSKGRQRIYGKGSLRVTIPLPKIVKQALAVIDEAQTIE